jgi:hypothetical protein
VIDYVHLTYPLLFDSTKDTVSLHFRLGYPKDGDLATTMQRKFPTQAWYRHVLGTVFNPSKVVFFVFSDNLPQSIVILDELADLSLDLVIVDENAAVSLFMMSKTKHHIMGCSTFSFWGRCDC